MATATAPSNAPTSRIPAWQRLGLKLKSAKQPHAVEPETSSPTKKRKIGVEDTPPTKQAKKTKPSVSAEPATPKLARKKSVTFTPETKVEDGDSIKQLFNDWVAEQKFQDPSFELKTSSPAFDTPEPSEVKEQFDTSLDEKERRVKRVKPQAETESKSAKDTPKKKQKQKEHKVIKPIQTTTRPFLAYLKQYHEDRPNWKFNKNHQNHILKHAFDRNTIPPDHIYLVYEYVRGLQGGVRTRLRDAALAIKIKDQEEGAAGFSDGMGSRNEQDKERRQREYEEGCREYVATMTAVDASKKMGCEEGVLLGLSDVAMKDRVAKRARSELILAELGRGATIAEAEELATPRDSGLTYSEEVIGGGNASNETAGKVSRRRKQRTSANVQDTSPSDDSSGSDSDSDSGESESGRQAQRADDTSSSSSSSSSDSGSTDGDSDDDSDDSDGSGSGSGSDEESDSE